MSRRHSLRGLSTPELPGKAGCAAGGAATVVVPAANTSNTDIPIKGERRAAALEPEEEEEEEEDDQPGCVPTIVFSPRGGAPRRTLPTLLPRERPPTVAPQPLSLSNNPGKKEKAAQEGAKTPSLIPSPPSGAEAKGRRASHEFAPSTRSAKPSSSPLGSSLGSFVTSLKLRARSYQNSPGASSQGSTQFLGSGPL